MLFSRRKQQEELARREQAGEVLWKPAFESKARVRIVHAIRATGTEGGVYQEPGERVRAAHQMICEDLGVFFLADAHKAEMDPASDVLQAVLEGDSDMIATVIEAVYRALAGPEFNRYHNRDDMEFAASVRTILAEHRVAFDLIDGQMVPFESREMHSGVVEPAVRLLGGQRGWEGVERAYRKALEEIATDPADAITDAGTALQEALVLLGCAGNALGPLGKHAVANGLVSRHDQKLIDWVSADRSQTGDTHNSAPATRDDAWFAVHIVGALILRLAGETPR